MQNNSIEYQSLNRSRRQRALDNECGASMVEHAIIILLVALGCIVSLQGIASAMTDQTYVIVEELAAAGDGSGGRPR